MNEGEQLNPNDFLSAEMLVIILSAEMPIIFLLEEMLLMVGQDLGQSHSNKIIICPGHCNCHGQGDILS